MEDILFSPTGSVVQLTVLMFYWVPFALTAYLYENWQPERARHALQRLIHPFRHTPPTRPMAHGAG